MYRKTLIVLAVLAISACQSDKQAKLVDLKKKQMKISAEISQLEEELAAEGKAPKETGKLVAVEAAKTAVFDHFIEVQGKVDGEGNVAVFPESAGVIEKIFVKPGSKVSKGQVLAQLNDPALQEQLTGLKTNYQLASDLYNKQKALWDKNIGSEVQYLQAKTNKEALEAQMAALQSQMNMMRIKSPIAGTIEEAPYKVGQMALPQAAAFRVVSFNALRVKASVSESYASRVHEGDLVKINILDLNREIEAKITFVSKYIDPVNRTFQVEVAVAESFDYLKVNMVVALKINDYQNPAAFVLPVSIIQSDYQGNSYVFLVKESGTKTAVKTVVKVGSIYNGNAEILEGLAEGDKIVVAGFQELENGKTVQY